jgi:hypothetical protein
MLPQAITRSQMQGASACEQSLRVNSFLYKTEKRMVAATKWLFVRVQDKVQPTPR